MTPLETSQFPLSWWLKSPTMTLAGYPMRHVHTAPRDNRHRLLPSLDSQALQHSAEPEGGHRLRLSWLLLSSSSCVVWLAAAFQSQNLIWKQNVGCFLERWWCWVKNSLDMLGYLFILRVPYPHFGGAPSSCHHAMHHVSTGGMGRLSGSHQRTAGGSHSKPCSKRKNWRTYQ